MADRVRTLFHVFPTFAVGGAQIRFVELANHFGTRYRHVIAAMDGITTAADRLLPGLDLTVVPLSNRRGAALHNIVGFRNVLRKVRPDVLVTSNWGTIEWAIAKFHRGVPHLHMEDGFGPGEAHGQFARRIWARRLLLRQSTVIVPSVTLASIARNIWRLPKKRILQIPNGVNCARFRSAPDRQLMIRLGISADRPVIGAVAPLRPEKNLRRLIESFSELRRHREAQLAIVGDGPERANLERCAVEYGVGKDVTFTGFCPTPEKLLPAFAVVAISSDTEQMPLAALEAMAAGRAIAATEVGDIRNMLTLENQPFVVDKNAKALADAMMRLLADPAEAAAIGRANARRAAEVFDQAKMFRQYRILFDQTGRIEHEEGTKSGDSRSPKLPHL